MIIKVEVVAWIARRVIFRNIERHEVVEDILDFRPTRDGETHPREDVCDLFDRLRQRMQATETARRAGEGEVKRLHRGISAAGRFQPGLQLALGTDGSLLRMGQLLDSHLQVPQSVEVDGTWSTDENLRRSVWGPVVEISYGDRLGLASWDATGDVLWSSDIRFPSREGFMYGRSGDVEVAVSCGPVDDVSPCPDERVVGVDADTGRELWSLPGWRIVGPMADGIAYVTDTVDVMAGEQPTGWFVLDTRTGRVADAPSWSALDTFRTGCCGEYDYQHTSHLGGILVAVSGSTMRVWLPASLTPPTVATVTLA